MTAQTTTISWARAQQALADHQAVLIWIETPTCNVCHALRPKVASLLGERFPRIHWLDIDAATAPDLAAQLQVFAFPTLLVYFEGRPSLRLSRHLSLDQLRDALERPYRLLFGDDNASPGI